MKHRQFNPGDLVYWIHDEVPCINVFICLACGADHVALIIRPGGEVRWRLVDDLLEIP
jgi:hypothetical protein